MMATKNQKNPDTAESLLKSLSKTYDFSPAMNKRIDNVLKTVSVDNPLAHPPEFLGTEYDDEDGISISGLPVPRISQKAGSKTIVRLGMAHGYAVAILKYPNATSLIVGCREFDDAEDARRHWQDGENRNGDPRPHAAALIDYVVKVCKHLGWKW
jgi:hypothetical protein